MAAKKKSDEDLDIPEFLRRKGGSGGGPPLPRLSSDRDWIMPGDPRSSTAQRAEAETAEEVEIECVDPALPVFVTHSKVGEVSSERYFRGISEFEKWFVPARHKVVGSKGYTDRTTVRIVERTTVEIQRRIEEVAKADMPRADHRKGKRSMRVEETPIPPPSGVVESYVHGPDDATIAHKKAVARAEQARVGAIPPSPKGKRRKARKPKVPRGTNATTGDGRGGHNMGVSTVRHGVEVEGVVYKSVYAAFTALKLKIPKHGKFRAELKKSKDGKLPYTENGKRYDFKLVAEPKGGIK